MKPGYQTTEFHVTVTTLVLSVAVMLGVVSPSDVPFIEDGVSKAIVQLGALLTTIAAVWKYIDSRTKVKVAEAVIQKVVPAVVVPPVPVPALEAKPVQVSPTL